MLGMLAAGAAKGLAHASNLNVQAEQDIQKELMREQIRQAYEDRKYTRDRRDLLADREQATELEQKIYTRNRGDKVADTEAEREYERKNLEFTEGNEMQRHRETMGASAGQHRERMAVEREQISATREANKARHGNGIKMRSQLGNRGADIYNSGGAADLNEGIRIAAREKAFTEISKRIENLGKTPEQIWPEVLEHTERLFQRTILDEQIAQAQGGPSGGILNSGNSGSQVAATKPPKDYNEKTGRFE